jgi:hypothetical protein
MGVTIHFEGKLKDEASFNRIMITAKAFADAQGWPYEEISNQETTLQRVRGEEDWDYVGPTRGIEIQPHKNSEPLRLEFDEDLYVQEFIKTQFAPQEIHILISKLFHSVASEFSVLEIDDEAEYFETGDESILEHHRKRFFDALDEYLAQEDKYYGPVVLESGRIIDVMERE